MYHWCSKHSTIPTYQCISIATKPKQNAATAVIAIVIQYYIDCDIVYRKSIVYSVDYYGLLNNCFG